MLVDSIKLNVNVPIDKRKSCFLLFAALIASSHGQVMGLSDANMQARVKIRFALIKVE